MIQSIQTGSTSIYSPAGNSVLGTAKLSTGTEKTSVAEKNEDETTSTSSQGDTLTISAAGAKQASKTFTGESSDRPSVTTSTDAGYTDSRAAAISSAASGAGITEYTTLKNEDSADAAAVSSDSSASASSSSSSSSSLSQYTDSQLKEMLQKGEITQAEYDAEIKSRQESDDSSDDDSDSSTSTSDTSKTSE